MWGMLFLILLSFSYLEKAQVSTTGYIPLTGIIDSSQPQNISYPNVSVDFEMKEKDIYKLRDIEYKLHIKPDLKIKTILDISYIITNSTGTVVFMDEASIIIDGETTINTNMDSYKSQEVNLPEGDYTFLIKLSYMGQDMAFQSNFKIKQIPEWLYSLKQLFDIRMDIEDTVLDSPDQLSAKVTFESFGSEPTPVYLDFFIYDSAKNKIYEKEENITVQTEMVFFEDFKGFDAAPGEYEVVLRTVYNVDVEDYFRQKITIKDKLDWLPLTIAGSIILIGLFVLFFVKRSSS